MKASRAIIKGSGAMGVIDLPVPPRKRGRSQWENKCGNKGESELDQHCPRMSPRCLYTRSVLADHARTEGAHEHGVAPTIGRQDGLIVAQLACDRERADAQLAHVAEGHWRAGRGGHDAGRRLFLA